MLKSTSAHRWKLLSDFENFDLLLLPGEMVSNNKLPKGRVPEKKRLIFRQTPLGPPLHGFVFFTRKKLTHYYFFLKRTIAMH